MPLLEPNFAIKLVIMTIIRKLIIIEAHSVGGAGSDKGISLAEFEEPMAT